ncbi:hypothetical protein [Gemmatimonas phototrophica]|uniref:Uncharacterized protein n=1 Tax=Gemmatimonas phototrophica TaxID=1379270 RepID=A0A143BKJ6_9BACT|nr:hypothetical protein [Gemmatimonas phototrophica]AMW05597.1 hypothetical protein GEMMAAP_13835 [Gemmatimonas phototrophica]
MARSAWSRWTLIVLAFVAGFASPGLAVAHGVAHAHGAEHHGHRAEHHHEHHGDHSSNADNDYDGATLSEQDHGHAHGHARVVSIATGKPDIRSALEAPVLVGAAAVDKAIATHERPALSRWDIVSLARPAPNTGPPPALRAPPTC